MTDDKRLTNGELAVEWNRSCAVTAIHGPHAEGNRVAVLQRFIDHPHAHETDYQ